MANRPLFNMKEEKFLCVSCNDWFLISLPTKTPVSGYLTCGKRLCVEKINENDREVSRMGCGADSILEEAFATRSGGREEDQVDKEVVSF